MRVDIVFHTSSTPKIVDDVVAVYTKGNCTLCTELPDGLIVKYPLSNVFSWSHFHQPHRGTTKRAAEAAEGGK